MLAHLKRSQVLPAKPEMHVLGWFCTRNLLLWTRSWALFNFSPFSPCPELSWIWSTSNMIWIAFTITRTFGDMGSGYALASMFGVFVVIAGFIDHEMAVLLSDIWEQCQQVEARPALASGHSPHTGHLTALYIYCCLISWHWSSWQLHCWHVLGTTGYHTATSPAVHTGLWWPLQRVAVMYRPYGQFRFCP